MALSSKQKKRQARTISDEDLRRLKEMIAYKVKRRCRAGAVGSVDGVRALLARLEAAEAFCKAMDDAWKVTVVIGPERIASIDPKPIQEKLEAWRQAAGKRSRSTNPPANP